LRKNLPWLNQNLLFTDRRLSISAITAAYWAVAISIWKKDKGALPMETPIRTPEILIFFALLLRQQKTLESLSSWLR
jgi:hypothetical protein